MDYWDVIRDLVDVPFNGHDNFERLKRLGSYAGEGLDWLGESLGLTDADQNELDYMMTTLPVVGPMMKGRDNYNWMNDYLRNNGLTWADALYPTRLPGSGVVSTALTSGYNFVSRNLEHFYD